MMLDNLVVESVTEISAEIFELVFLCRREMPDIAPGQFINIYPKNPALTLPRPISVCEARDGRIRVIFKKVGKGTEEFSAYSSGDIVKAMFPLGKGFDIASVGTGRRAVIIGGGIGTPPLLSLASSLKSSGADISVFMGFVSEPFLIDEFKKLTENVYVSTEDGSHGEKGNVVDLLRKHDEKGGVYFACGPVPMLRAVCGYIEQKGGKGQISLEQRMACGFGACVGCAVKIKSGDGWQYMKACKDGPVFDYKEVLWD